MRCGAAKQRAQLALDAGDAACRAKPAQRRRVGVGRVRRLVRRSGLARESFCRCLGVSNP